MNINSCFKIEAKCKERRARSALAGPEGGGGGERRREKRERICGEPDKVEVI